MPKYQYGLVDVKYVKENPEEYIIPDCIDACKILWGKGINTAQCSNLEDKNYRWIEIDTLGLSDENKKIIYDLINAKEEGFSIGGMTHNPRLFVYGEGVEASKALCQLASVFVLQDTMEYSTTEEYLDNYKRKDGEYVITDTGVIIRDYNPKLVSTTLSDALTFNDDWSLYVEEERRIYHSIDALESHMNYIEQLKNENRIKR